MGSLLCGLFVLEELLSELSESKLIRQEEKDGTTSAKTSKKEAKNLLIFLFLKDIVFVFIIQFLSCNEAVFLVIFFIIA